MNSQPDTTRVLLAKWDVWKATVDGQSEITAYRALRDHIETIRAPLVQGHPTAAELLSEIIAEFDGQIMLDGFVIRRVSAIVDRARALGYGAAKAVTP